MRKWLKLFSLLVAMYLFVTLWGKLAPRTPVIEQIEAKGIDATPLFYTESEEAMNVEAVVSD